MFLSYIQMSGCLQGIATLSGLYKQYTYSITDIMLSHTSKHFCPILWQAAGKIIVGIW